MLIRSHTRLLLLTVLAMLTLGGTLTARPLQASAAQNTTRSLLIQFDAGASAAQRDALIADLNGELLTWIAPLSLAEVAVPVDSTFVSAAAAGPLEIESAIVRFAEADVIVYGTYMPNDPDLADQAKSYALQKIAAPGAWDYADGQSAIVIATLDTGLNGQHPEFAGRIVPGYDFANDDNDPTDDHGHGTHAAGIIAASADNGQGTAGVCPQCTIMPIKVLDHLNRGSWANVTQGIVYAVDNGASVINLSLGAAVASRSIERAIDYAESNGVLVIAAAGNNDTDQPFYPAAFENVVAVAATDADDGRWRLSNYGEYIDLAAPGHGIYSTYHELDNYYGGYAFMSGTSMAAPHVAGLAGLLLSQEVERTAAEVVALMKSSADDLGPAGWDAEYGYGRINALAALTGDSSAESEPVESQAAQEVPVALGTIFLPVLTLQ